MERGSSQSMPRPTFPANEWTLRALKEALFIANGLAGLQDGVRAHSPPTDPRTPQRLNNPEHAKANIALLLCWVRPPTELGTLGFSVVGKAHHTHLLKNLRSLATWGRLSRCGSGRTVHRFTQCHRCSKLNHYTANCQSSPVSPLQWRITLPPGMPGM